MLKNCLDVRISLRFKSLTNCFCLNSISCIIFSSSCCFSLFCTGSMSMYCSSWWRFRPLAFSMIYVCESHYIISLSYFICGCILIFLSSNMSRYYYISSLLFTCPNITLLSDCKSTKAMKHLSLLCLRVSRTLLVSLRSILVLSIWRSLLPERTPTSCSYDLCLIFVLRISFFKN